MTAPIIIAVMPCITMTTEDAHDIRGIGKECRCTSREDVVISMRELNKYYSTPKERATIVASVLEATIANTCLHWY